MREVTGELFEPMARATRMIEVRLEGVLAHCTRGLTIALMEGLGSRFSAVDRRARGYRTVEYVTAMFYFVSGTITLPRNCTTENSKESL
jgi:transposase